MSDWEAKFQCVIVLTKNPIIVDHSKQVCARLEFDESLHKDSLNSGLAHTHVLWSTIIGFFVDANTL